MRLTRNVVMLLFHALLVVGYAPIWEDLGGSGMAAEGASCHFIDGKFVVFGGRTSFRTWVSTALRIADGGRWKNLPVPGEEGFIRSFHAAVPYMGKVYVFGGRTGLFSIANDILVVDPAVPSIQAVNPLGGTPPSPRQTHAAAIIGSKVYIHGGSTDPQLVSASDELFVYDLEANTWDFLGNGGGLRMGHQLVAYQDKLFAFGGSDAGSSYITRDVTVYDTKTGKWSVAPSQLEPRTGHTATVIDGKAWLIAGRNDKGMLGDVVVWNLAENRPEAAPAGLELRPPRQGHCAAYEGGEGKPILIYGGSLSYSKYFDSLQRLYLQPSGFQVLKRQQGTPKVVLSRGDAAVPKESALLFQERFKKVRTRVRAAALPEVITDGDVSENLAKATKLLSQPLPTKPQASVSVIKVHCLEFEASITGEEEARARLEEETSRLKELQQRANEIAGQHETNEAEMNQLMQEVENWTAKYDDLTQKLQEAEGKYESYDRNKESLKEDLRRLEAERSSAADLLDVNGKSMRLALLTLKSREEQFNNSKAKKDGQVSGLEALEQKVREKEEEIAEAKQKLVDAETNETSLDTQRTDLSKELESVKEKIAVIQKLLFEQRNLAPKIQEAQRVQRSAEEMSENWIQRVRAVAEPLGVETTGPTSCTGVLCDPPIDKHMKSLLDLLAQQELLLKTTEQKKVDVETELQNIITRRDALEKHLNVLEAELTDLQRQLRTLRYEQEYENRNLPKLEELFLQAQLEITRLETERKGYDIELARVMEIITEKKRQLDEEDKAFSGYTDMHQQLSREKHAAALKRESALDALETRMEHQERARKDRKEIRRRLGDAVREWDAIYSAHAKHARDLEVLYSQLAGSSGCDGIVAALRQAELQVSTLTQSQSALMKQAEDSERALEEMQRLLAVLKEEYNKSLQVNSKLRAAAEKSATH